MGEKIEKQEMKTIKWKEMEKMRTRETAKNIK